MGHLLLPGLFDGEHVFAIEPVSEKRVLFKQSEQFRGLLLPLLWSKIGDKTRRGFESMNQAIKLESERVRRGGAPLWGGGPAMKS